MNFVLAVKTQQQDETVKEMNKDWEGIGRWEGSELCAGPVLYHSRPSQLPVFWHTAKD